MQKKLAAQLDTVHSVISDTLAICSKEKHSKVLKAALSKASSEINETVVALATSSKSRSLLKTRKSLVAIENTLTSLHEGLASREISVSDFRAVCSNLETKFIPNFVKNLSEEVSRLPLDDNTDAAPEPDADLALPVADPRVTAVLAAGGRSIAEQLAGIKAMLHAAPKIVEHDPESENESEEERAERLEKEREVDRLRREGVSDLNSINTLAQLRAKRNNLPTRLTKLQPYSIVKLPLVPVFTDNPFIIEGKGSKFERTLNALAIKYTPIQGYAFLEDQLILCVSKNDIDIANLRHKESVKDTAKGKVKVEKKAQKSNAKAIESIEAELVNYATELQKANKKYEEIKTLSLALGKEQRAITDEIKAISPKEYERTFAKSLHRKRKYAELTEAETKRLVKIVEGTKHQPPSPATLEKMKDHEKEEAREAYRKEVEVILGRHAKAERSTLTLKQTKELSALIEKWKDLDVKLKTSRALQRRINDYSEMVKNAKTRKAELESRVDVKDEGIKAIRKAARPKYNDVTPADYAMSVLAHINEISHSTYNLVVQDFKVNVRNSDILCFWIMPAQKLNRFLRLGSSTAKIQWAFPWDA